MPAPKAGRPAGIAPAAAGGRTTGVCGLSVLRSPVSRSRARSSNSRAVWFMLPPPESDAPLSATDREQAVRSGDRGCGEGDVGRAW